MLRTIQAKPYMADNIEDFSHMGRTKSDSKAESSQSLSQNDSASGSFDQVCTALLPRVRRLAKRVKGRLPAHVELSELESAGYVGLVSALRRHWQLAVGERELKVMARVRGAVYDYLREQDPLSRRDRRAEKQQEHMLMRALLRQPKFVALDESRLADAVASPSLVTVLEWPGVMAALGKLPERTRRSVELYYALDGNYRDVGKQLGVSHVRAFQLHRRGLQAMRETLGLVA